MSALPVIRASDFVDAIGVNVHLPYTDGAYARVDTVLADLHYLGIDHVRDWVINDKPYPGDEGQLSYPVAAAAGIKFDMNVISGADIPHALQQLDAFIARYPGSVTAIEGPNEVNNWPVNYAGLTGDAAAVAFQNALYAAVKADPALAGIPVVELTSWPVLVGGADQANLHFYSGGAQPMQTLATAVAGQQQLLASHAVSITEAGYATYAGGVDQLTQAKLTLNLLFDAAKLGVKSTYLYELLDAYADPSGTDSEKHYGLFDLHNQPKLAAVGLHNLTTILADPGAAATSFVPTAGNFAFSGLGPLDAALALQKSSGATDLVVWSEPEIWDLTTHNPIGAPAHVVTLELGTVYADVTVYDPLLSSTPLSVLHQVSSVQLSLMDHPLIVEVAGSSSSSAASPISPRHLDGAGGADTLAGVAGGVNARGLDGDDSLLGGADADTLNGNTGSDSLDGGAGSDWVMGGQGSDSVTGGQGDDTLNGNRGEDTVVDTSGANFIYGGQGDDRLIAGAGTDTLSGDLGADTLTGGDGADRFLFRPGSGHDLVTDFSAAQGDRVALASGVAYVVYDLGGHAVVDLGGGDVLEVVGANAGSAGDWLLAG